MILSSSFLDTKFRRTVEEFQRSTSHSPLCAIKPRKEFPSLRSRSKTVSSLRQRQIEQYFKEENIPRIKNGSRKAVTFDLSSTRQTESIVKRPPVTVLQAYVGEPKTYLPHPDKLLLRRPKKATQSFTIDDEFFVSLAESIQLRPLNFKTSNDQYIYYSQNYPLLLDANAEDKTVVRKRTPTPEITSNIAAKRSVNLKARLNMLESSLDTLDKETEDVDFKTVLRDDVFYPNRWPWNEKKPSEDDLLE